MDTQGSLWAIFLYDVAEQIDLEALRSILRIEPAAREPRFKHPAPDYVRFERPPLEHSVTTPPLESGERVEARLKYFDYGVLLVELELPFQTEWATLLERSSRWIGSPEMEKLAGALARDHASRASSAFTQPNTDWLSEDYY